MAFWNWNTGGSENSATNKFAFKFRKGQKEDKPHFLVEQFAWEGAGNEFPTASEIQGTLKGVFYNVSDKPEYSDKLKVILQDEDEVYYIEFSMNPTVIPLINSLLNTTIWEEIKIVTFTNKEWYKNLAVFNPNKKVEITTKDGKKITVDESYKWVYKKDELPKVSITKNKAGKVVDVDDAELNAFFADKINDRFGKKDENTEESNEWNISISDVPF